MNAARRMTEISRLIEKQGAVDVKELAKELHVTPKTIRLDLDKMAEMDLVDRVHGGAIVKRNGASFFEVQARQQTNVAEKESIARQALAHVEPKDTMILDGGSTTFPLARLLDEQFVTVMTNDLRIALELVDKLNIDLFLTGGKISSHRREGTYTLLGSDAEHMLSKYKVHKLFLAATALDVQKGLMVYSEDLAETKKAMIRSAEQTICLLDYSKFHKQAFTPFARLEDIDVIITDSRIPDQDIRALEKLGISVEVAP
ncbi:MAG: DeoR/GlpR family DNA-binding transcription regulator [Limnochordia bacterium]|nr:DeoR/GlpR family DNA-binding transcription regulator [Limnochordia bacterium]